MMEDTETYKVDNTQSKSFTPNPKYMTQAEDALLFRLKERRSLSWADIAAYFPDRKQASLQVRYYRGVKKRRDQKPEISGDKLVVNNSTDSSQRTISASSERTISASSERSHLSRAAKRKVQLPRIEPYSKLNSSTRFNKSAGNNTNSELASTINPQFTEITSKNKSSTIEKSKGERVAFATKRKSTIAKNQNCNSNNKNLPDIGSNGVKANCKKKRTFASIDNQNEDTERKKIPRLEAEEAQVDNDSPKVPQSNIADDSLKSKGPVTRRMADKSKRAASLYKIEDHEEPATNDDIIDSKIEANKARKTLNRNPPQSGSCPAGWVPVPPLSPSDPRYPGIIPKVFVHPPPTRIIEYHTGSGSFRIRTRRPSDDLRVGALILQHGTPVYKPTDPRHKNYEGDRQKAQMETEKMAARVGESFKTTKVGVMSPKKEKGSDEETSSDEDYND